MDVIVIESKAFKEILNQQNEKFEKTIQKISKDGNVKEWIDESEAMEILGIKSKSTLQRYRDMRLIRFSQHGLNGGRIIKYDKLSILKYLNQNAIDPLDI